jgi:RNA polymerase sigma-70 factor (ECF subfamily)
MGEAEGMRSTTTATAGRRQEEAAGSPEPTPDAQLAFLRASLPRVHGYLLARCGDRAAAEDLLGETVLAAAKQLRRVPTTELTMAWLLTVARNKHVDAVRRSVRERRALALASDATALAVADVADSEEELDLTGVTRERTLAALAAVPPAQRGVLVLHYLDELPVADVAELIGRSVHATESLLARGRASFRAAYRAEDGVDA